MSSIPPLPPSAFVAPQADTNPSYLDAYDTALTQLYKDLASLEKLGPVTQQQMESQYSDLLGKIQKDLVRVQGLTQDMEDSNNPLDRAVVNNPNGNFWSLTNDLGIGPDGHSSDSLFAFAQEGAAGDQDDLANALATFTQQHGMAGLNDILSDINNLDPQG